MERINLGKDPFKVDVVGKGFLAGFLGIWGLLFGLYIAGIVTFIWAVIKLINWITA